MSIALILARLDRELVPKGFIRKKMTWNRAQESLVQVIDVQASKGGHAVTINAGVLARSIHFDCWGYDIEGFIEEPFCTVHARAGQLLENSDKWWDAGDRGVAEEMATCLETSIFPFLDRMKSMEEMCEWLARSGVPTPKAPLPSINFALLRLRLGDFTGACSALAQLESKALGSWKERAREIAARVGCMSNLSRHH